MAEREGRENDDGCGREKRELGRERKGKLRGNKRSNNGECKGRTRATATRENEGKGRTRARAVRENEMRRGDGVSNVDGGENFGGKDVF